MERHLLAGELVDTVVLFNVGCLDLHGVARRFELSETARGVARVGGRYLLLLLADFALLAGLSAGLLGWACVGEMRAKELGASV